MNLHTYQPVNLLFAPKFIFVFVPFTDPKWFYLWYVLTTVCISFLLFLLMFCQISLWADLLNDNIMMMMMMMMMMIKHK